jgi:hypothetical protein
MAFNSWGSSRFPLTVSASVDVASQLDTGLHAISGLCVAAIEANCQAAWLRFVSNSHDRHWLRSSSKVVGHVLAGVRPDAQNLTQIGTDWPLLCIYRESSEFEPITASLMGRKQKWGVDWIVGPLDPASQIRFGAFWGQVLNSIAAAIVDGYHPSYLNGADCFHGEFVSIVPTSETGAGVSAELVNDKGAGYWGGSIVLESVERFVPQSGAAIDTLNAAGTAYAPADAGYGDNWTETAVVVPIPDGTNADLTGL